MATASLTDVFGSGSTQDASTLVIQKTALQAKGLTPTASNSPESLLVAIIMLAADQLNELNRATDPINRHVSIMYSGQDLFDLGGINYRRDTYSLMLFKQTVLTPVDPDDY